MSFLFKSKKNQERSLSSRDGPPQSSQSSLQSANRMAREEKASLSRSTPTGSLNSLDNDGTMTSPDQAYNRRPSGGPGHQPDSSQSSDLPFRNGGQPMPGQQQVTSPNASLYPWSQRRLTYTSSHPSPFPRYGAAVNSVSSKEGDIYVMGGLINSATVKGDLWLIEAGGSLACYPLATTAEGPGPRVGHASLLVGNAFIVYGGDTKIDEADILDETLYLLNTSTRQWSRALPAGPRPSGRYGHSLNILGSKIYIFGGQVEGYFMNDMAAFDLNQLQMPNNRWELLLQNSDSGGPPIGKVPPARTNHTMITYHDKMYLFGGTNGFQWFNDVWSYDPATNSWTQLDCIGYIPVPREGHAAALVDDVMYIFGGRTEEGTDLGDLAAFRITSHRWYTFQNMGPSPSARSGHSMTTVGKAVVVVGGEPSSAASVVNDLGLIYVLDTSKIRYPNDSQVPSSAAAQRTPQSLQSSPQQGQEQQQAQQQFRRPSTGPNEPPLQAPVIRAIPPSESLPQAPPEKMMAARDAGATKSPPNGFRPPNGSDQQSNANVSKIPRAGASPPTGPPQQGQPPKPAVNTEIPQRPRNASVERTEMAVSPVTPIQPSSPVLPEATKVPPEAMKTADAPGANGRRTPSGQLARSASKGESAAEASKSRQGRQGRGQGSVDSSTEPTLKAMAARPSSPPPPTRQNSNPLSRRSSHRNSQTVALLKELDMSRSRNAWYASELELARKSGYVPSPSLSPLLESRGAETFDDEDKPLIEALLAMRAELANVQASVDKQAVFAAKQISEAERQRDVAIQEAVYAKAKLAARGGGTSGTPQPERDPDGDDQTGELKRRLASTINGQKELQNRIDRLTEEVAAEKRSRLLADENANAAQKRMMDLENYKQQNSLETESLRAELHQAQKEAREQAVAAADAAAAAQMLRLEKDELEAMYQSVSGSSKQHGDALTSVRAALAASTETKDVLERRLDEERAQREKAEGKLSKLKAEHEARTAELVAATQRLRDAEELAEKHAAESRLHKAALVTGIEQIAAQDKGRDRSKADSERITALQGQLNVANTMVKKYQQQADAAASRLRSAEERIAGLEVFQEQASREGMSIRKQLQAALRETQSLQASNSDLKQQLAGQQLETNAMTVQHNTLKNILIERGISPSGSAAAAAARVRGGSPRDASHSPDLARVRELEQQLGAAQAMHEESRQTFVTQAQETEKAYREKLSQLENDYQSAVHYVKGTEKMLKKLKEEMTRYKNENSRLKSELVDLEDKEKKGAAAAAPAGWETEKATLTRKIETLQSEMISATAQLERQMQAVRTELDSARRERDSAVRNVEEASERVNASQKDLEQLQRENSLLERRAQDAEMKVSLLLDQVETSVDNYRRRSRQVASMGSDQVRDSTGSIGGANGGGKSSFSLSPNTVPGAFGGGTGNGMNMGGGGPSQSHARSDSADTEGSSYGVGGGGGDRPGDERNSAALDSLANELDMLRSQWEATNKNYRLSTNTVDFESGTAGGYASLSSPLGVSPSKKGGSGDADKDDNGLSESLADWRKRLDNR